MSLRLARRRSRPESGSGSVEFLAAVGVGLVAFVLVANLAVWQYGRGVVRAALDEGARAGSRVGVESAATCEARAGEVLADLLGGAMGDGVRLRCAEEDGVVRARADVVFPAWLPGVPSWGFRATGVVVKEAVR